MANRPDVETLEASVLGYLERHPGAMDSLEGIAEFWIARNRLRTDVMDLVGVLKRLVATGMLEQVGEGPRALYRMRRPPTAGGAEPLKQ